MALWNKKKNKAEPTQTSKTSSTPKIAKMSRSNQLKRFFISNSHVILIVLCVVLVGLVGAYAFRTITTDKPEEKTVEELFNELPPPEDTIKIPDKLPEGVQHPQEGPVSGG